MSEITKEQAELRNKDTNELIYSATNITNHMFPVTFLNELMDQLHQFTYHIAKKRLLIMMLQ